ncbi:unnamed protein product, partial [Arabidopsis halleri]
CGSRSNGWSKRFHQDSKSILISKYEHKGAQLSVITKQLVDVGAAEKATQQSPTSADKAAKDEAVTSGLKLLLHTMPCRQRKLVCWLLIRE